MPRICPIPSSAPRPLQAAYVPILLNVVEQEQRPRGNGDREAIVVGAGLCDDEGERAYNAYARHFHFFDVFPLLDVIPLFRRYSRFFRRYSRSSEI